MSKVNVAWHLDHMLKTINVIYDNLEESNPEEYKAAFNVSRFFSHTFNYIPRGFTQSPDKVKPPDIITLEAIEKQLKEVKRKVSSIDQLDKKSFFEHPVFKNLDRKQSKRFMQVHTEHHLKIVRDILKSNE